MSEAPPRQPSVGDNDDRTDRAAAVSHLVSPRSIAIVGASADLSKINGRPLKHLLDKGYAGRIYPINPKYPQIAGVTCYATVAALPEAPDMAVVALPAREVPDCIEALGDRGVRAAVIFSSGFGEMGAEGLRLQEQLLERAHRHGVVLCGPNCLGLVNGFDAVYATFSQYADGEANSGPIAFVTQSGAFGTAIAALARERGLGLGYFINTGNEADLGFSELMAAVIEDPRIKVGAGYLEGVRDGAALVRLARRCHELGKPLVLTKVGRKAAGVRAAASHTGALAVEDTVFDDVIRQFGVLRARNEEQMIDMLEALSGERRARGDGVGIATQSGGAGVMMADRAEELGLRVPQLSAATQSRLAGVMPAFGAAGNPVDVTGQFVARPDVMRESVVALMDDPAIDVAIVWLQLMTAHVDLLVRLFTEIRDRTDKPMLVCWVAAPPEAARRLRAAGIPVYPAGERAVEAAAALVRQHQARGLRLASPRIERPAWVDRWDPQDMGVRPSLDATRMLTEAGIPMAELALARSEDEAVACWRSGAGPVALKIESPDITHKTEVGGVLLGVDSEDEVRNGFRTLLRGAQAAAPHARVLGVLVQRMAPGHLELVLGVKRDPGFGMIVMVGLGGILVEVLEDVAFRLAPFGEDEALRMLAQLRMSALLDGVRGQPAIDRVRLAQVVSRLSRWAASVEPVLSELDLNPMRVGADGPVGVDCVMVFRQAHAGPADRPNP